MRQRLQLLDLRCRQTKRRATGLLSVAAPAPHPTSIQQVIGWLPAQASLIWTRLPANAPTSETVERWGHPRAEFALHRALKQAIDPRATFNPGRFYTRL